MTPSETASTVPLRRCFLSAVTPVRVRGAPADGWIGATRHGGHETGGGDTRVARWLRYLPYAWSAGLALLMLGPALGRGYVLSYDMVWVPDLSLRSSFLGLGSGLPRAVPSDAVVAVLDEIVPGMLLQKLVLLGALAGGGLGILRLAPRDSLTGQLVAVSVYQWNPFVAERLVLGHWPLLVGYAVLPWLVLAAWEWRTTGVLPWRLWWLVPLGSLSASAGLATGVVLVAFATETTPVASPALRSEE